jgi:hypothetical protein
MKRGKCRVVAEVGIEPGWLWQKEEPNRRHQRIRELIESLVSLQTFKLVLVLTCASISTRLYAVIAFQVSLSATECRHRITKYDQSRHKHKLMKCSRRVSGTSMLHVTSGQTCRWLSYATLEAPLLSDIHCLRRNC